jgi:hypothetical protein
MFDTQTADVTRGGKAPLLDPSATRVLIELFLKHIVSKSSEQSVDSKDLAKDVNTLSVCLVRNR